MNTFFLTPTDKNELLKNGISQQLFDIFNISFLTGISLSPENS